MGLPVNQTAALSANAPQAPPYDPREDLTQPIGPNNENLKKELQLEIWNLLMAQERADEIPRRFEIKEILQRRLFFRSQQYWWYSDSQFMWFPPTQIPPNVENYEPPPFQHVTNIFQATLLGLMSVLSQSNTASRFWPEKASDPNDVQMAKNASKVVDLIHRNNDWQNKLDDATYYMGTDGFLGGYVRYVSDGERFGLDEQTFMGSQDVQIGSPMVACPSCGYADQGTTDTAPSCPDCGEATQDVPPQTATVPVPLGQIQIPKGQEVISIIGGLQLKRNMWADEQKDFLYLDWIGDIHRAKALATYPHVADKIKSSTGAAGTSGSADSYERIARRLLYLGTGRHVGMVLEDLGVMRRAWLRPALFEMCKNDVIKAALQSLYPKGCYVAFYNDVYCESREECMDEKWETMHAMPGEGQLRETIVSALVPIQEQYNDASNLIFEQGMNGVPEAFGDQNVIDFEARSKQVAAPGNMTPVDLAPNQDVRSKVLFSTAVEPSMALNAFRKELMNEVLEFISGYYAALAGGDTGSNDTAQGIAIQRNQALGRIGRVWRRLQLFCANLDGKAVHCFADNRTQDTEIPKQNDSGDYESDFVRMEDMQGNVVAYPEVDAQYPTLESDVRSLLMSLWNGENPIFLATMQEPENLEYFFDHIGAGDIDVPGEQQRKKTSKDIQQLIQEQPQQGQPQPQQPGMPPEPPPMVPSVVPDPLVDNLPVALETTKKWLISDQGMEMKNSNPAGYQNVYLYAKAIDQMQKQQQLQQAMVSQALAGQGPAHDLGGAEQMQPPKAGGGPENSPSGNQPSPSESPS